MKLLGPDEMKAYSMTDIGMLDRRPDVEKRLCEAQAVLTRQETLKEVGEWLENFPTTYHKVILLNEFREKFMSGKPNSKSGV